MKSTVTQFSANQGFSMRGTEVVLYYGILEIWLPWKAARQLAMELDREAERARLYDAGMKKRIRETRLATQAVRRQAALNRQRTA